MKPLIPFIAFFLVPFAWTAGPDFDRDVLPLLSDNCFKCHGPDENTREADLRLDTREGAFGDLGGGFYPVVPGKPEESEVIWRITAQDEEDVMPPPDSGLSLNDEQKRVIADWIKQGAEWKTHWAFEPVKRPEEPEVGRKDWAGNGIDRFVLARLEQEGLAPSPEADRTTLIRRVTLDLTGLPPTSEEVEAFLADRKPGAYERLVDRLLASPRYGEAMALPWLDAARYADTDGYQNDGPRSMWRWRDWVIDAYNRNLPFDQFTIEQLAGDLLPNPTLDQIIATGFNRNHRYNSESGLVLEEFLLENAVDRVDTTSTVWMGLTMACARCHDHKYDPFSTKEYYQLISYFNSVPESGRARKFGNSEPWITAPTADQLVTVEENDQRVEDAARALENSAGRIGKSQRSWEASGPRAGREDLFLSRGLTGYYSLECLEAGNEAVRGAEPESEEEELENEAQVETGQPAFVGGIVGSAARFDGASKLTIPFESAFLSEERWSLSFWVNPEQVNEGVIFSRQRENTQRPGIAAEWAEGHLQFYLITRWIAGVAAIETVETFAPGEWRHVTVTNDGTKRAKGIRIYLDGVEADSRILHNTNSNDGVDAKGAVFRLGGGVHGPNYVGMLDELRVYDRTLWEDEVPLLAEPTSVQQILDTESSRRSEWQAAKLQAYFLENGAEPELKELAQQHFEARQERTRYWDTLPTVMVMQETPEPKPTHVRIRGVYHDKGEVVQRDLPSALTREGESYAKNRLGFAQWLASGEHPLTARVAVNRYWLKYFGRGLVKTAEDFGVQGSRPSHPELLDWLADEFVRVDWNIKAMQKLIVTSATYRQSSRLTPSLLEKDPENVLLARGPRLRLSAHALRDQALAMSGLLVEKQGGPSVSPYQPDKLWENLSNMQYEQSQGEDLYRRSLYTIWKRTLPPPAMHLLDAANRESCIVSPKRTNTPLQALTLLNEKGFVEAARGFGQRILKEGGDSLGEQVAFAFQTATGRHPRQEERILLVGAYREYREAFFSDPDAAQRMIGIGESEPDPSLDPQALAAAMTLGNVLLNLDEVMTKE